MQTERTNIKHTFSDDERLALGDQQAQLLSKQDELEAQLKSAKAQIQAQIDSAEAEIRAVSSKLRARYEFRDVECIVMDHRVNGTRHMVRTDTGHVVASRKLRPDEMQIELSDSEPQSFVAIAALPVDDRAIDADFVELPVFEDEFEALRHCPDVRMRDIPPMLGSGKKAEKPEKKRKDRE